MISVNEFDWFHLSWITLIVEGLECQGTQAMLTHYAHIPPCRYLTIANAWFLLAALATDVLWLRFYLFLAYVFLCVAASTNYPPWGTWTRINGNLWLLGAILWPILVGKTAWVYSTACIHPFRSADLLMG